MFRFERLDKSKHINNPHLSYLLTLNDFNFHSQSAFAKTSI